MKRFHINAEGEVGECRSRQRACPFLTSGSNDNHFDSFEQAITDREVRLDSEFGNSSKTVAYLAGRSVAGDLLHGVDLDTIGKNPDINPQMLEVLTASRKLIASRERSQSQIDLVAQSLSRRLGDIEVNSETQAAILDVAEVELAQAQHQSFVVGSHLASYRMSEAQKSGIRTMPEGFVEDLSQTLSNNHLTGARVFFESEEGSKSGTVSVLSKDKSMKIDITANPHSRGKSSIMVVWDGDQSFVLKKPNDDVALTAAMWLSAKTKGRVPEADTILTEGPSVVDAKRLVALNELVRNDVVLSDVDGTIVKGSLVLDHACWLDEKGIIDTGGIAERRKADQKNEELITELADSYRKGLKGKTLNDIMVDEYVDEVTSDDSKFYFTLSRLQEASQSGSDVVLISGSPSFLVQPFGEKYGFEAAASEYEVDESGRFTSKVEGMFNASAKRDYVRSMGLSRYGHVSAFGDTSSDAPLFEVADSSILIDPTEQTRDTLRGKFDVAYSADGQAYS